MPDNKIDHKYLTDTYKRNGLFDKQRKFLLENFKESETHANLLLKLRLMVEGKIKNDPLILLKNRGKMGALIQGEIINQHHTNTKNSLLSIADKDIQEKIIDSPDFHQLLRDELKDIKRRAEGISDEDYAKMLEEEKAKAEEKKRQRDSDAYRYKKPLPSHKVTKVPRINFKARDKPDAKDVPFLMY